MPDVDRQAVLACMVAAAKEAATIGLDFAASGAKSWTKGDSSIVTEADLAIDAFLKERLRTAFPHFGWLSEETADNDERLMHRTIFVVDPIDGTRAFANGTPDWTISLALVDKGKPVVAVLAEPCASRLMTSIKGHGSFADGKQLHVRQHHSLAGARIGGSKPAMEKLRPHGAIDLPKVFSLALRIAKVALDELDVALSHPGAHDWDLAAADLLVQEAGGQLVTMDGTDIAYNQANPKHRAIVAANSVLCDAIRPIFQSFGTTPYSDALV